MHFFSEELSGIFVKSISKGSAAELSNKIQINDRIVKVNNYSLQGYSNHEAVEVLRNTGNTVHLCIERYLRGPKYEQLQQAIAASEIKLPQIYSPSITSLPSFSFSTVRFIATYMHIYAYLFDLLAQSECASMLYLFL